MPDALLEREDELELAEGLIEDARLGHGRLLVFEGPAGIGKTRLLAAVRRSARSARMEIVSARCGELEREFPFGVVRQLFEPRLAAAGSDERAALLAGAAGLAAPLLDAHADAGDVATGDASFAALHGLYWLAANLSSRRPLLITIDDLHACDAPSLRWLAFMSRRLEELPVLVAIGTRPSDPAAHGGLLDAVVADPLTRVVQPPPLSRAATERLVRDALGEDAASEFCEACHTVTAGNPFLLHELIATLLADHMPPTREAATHVRDIGPSTVSRSVLLRLARLPAAAPALARAVAVLGSAAELRDAAALAELEDDAAAEAADALTGADIFKSGRRLSFQHPIIRAAVHADLPSAERARMHARAARLLAAGGASAEQVAAHLMEAEPTGDRWVVLTLRAAARQALAKGGPDAAVASLLRALSEPPDAEVRADLLVELGLAEARAHRPAAPERLAQALGLIEDAGRRARVVLELGRLLLVEGRVAEAVETLEGPLADRDAIERDLALQIEAELVIACGIDPTLRPRAGALLTRAPDDLAGRGPGERSMLANMAAAAAWTGSSAAAAAELAERALGDGLLLAERGADAPAPFIAANVLTLTDRVGPARRFFEEALSEARERGSAQGFALASCWRAHLSYRCGDLVGAEDDARRALDLADEHGWVVCRPAALAVLIDVLLERDQPELAAAALAETDLGDDALSSGTWNLLLDSRAQLQIALGDVRGGLEDLLGCGRRQAAWGTSNPAIIPWRSHAALAHAALGEEDEARRLVAADVELARAFGAPRALGVALRAAGLVEGGERGVELLTEAVAVLERSPAVLEHARALTELGAAERRAGQRRAAQGLLRRGLDLAHRCQATALERRARGELVAAGARPRRAALSGVGALTASERRVVDMAVDGLGNREIAQALFVTIRTVEVHLTSAYRKLGVRSRAGLPAALASEHDDAPPEPLAPRREPAPAAALSRARDMPPART